MIALRDFPLDRVVVKKGQTVDVADAALRQRLVDAGYIGEATRTADAAPATETADAPPLRRRRKPKE